MQKILACLFAVGLLTIGAVAPVHAQATRTWVSGVGNDADPCSRTAPCKTFAGAISKTAAGGEINVLDPGGFGGVTITKSISIISESVEAGVLVSGTNGIIVNAAPGDIVYLRGLNFDGLGNGLSGLKIMQAASVVVDNCLIRSFKGAPGTGVSVVPGAADVKVQIANTRISNNVTGILVQPSGGHIATVTLDHVRIDNSSANAIDGFTAGAVTNLHASVIVDNFRALHRNNGAVFNTFTDNVLDPNANSSSSTTPLTLR